MKYILINLAFFLALSFGSTSLRAQTFQQDTAGAYNQGVSAESQGISNFASEILDWITGTVWGDIENLVENVIGGGITTVAGDIGDFFSSIFSAHHQKGANPAAVTDSTILAKNGVYSTGYIIGTSFGLWNTDNPTNGANIVSYPTLAQKTTYTVPDPGTATANFVLDAGNQTIGGKKTFSSDITGGSHILTTSSIGTVASDGTVVTSASAAGSDVAGKITLSTAASAGEGTATIQFHTAYSSPPIVVVTPANLPAQQGGHISGYYVTCNAGNFVLNVNNDAVGATGAVFNYIVIH